MAKTEPLALITCAILRASPALAGLDNVIELLDALLDHAGRFSLAAAAAHGSVDLFHRVHRNHHPTLSLDEALYEYHLGLAIQAAVKAENLPVLERIHELHPHRLPVRLVASAVRTGSLEMVQWLLENRDDDVCSTRDHRHDHPSMYEACCCLRDVYDEAIRCKHLHIVLWLHDNRYVKTLAEAGDLAARIGDVEAVERLHVLNHDGAFTVRAIDRAARHGHLLVVEFLLRNRTEGWSIDALNDAYFGGHHEITQLLHTAGIMREEMDANLARRIAKHQRIELFRAPPYATANAAYLSGVMIHACGESNADTVLWLVRERPMDQHTTTIASYGQLEALEWMNKTGVGRWGPEVMDAAAGRRHLSLVQWLHDNRTEGCTISAMNSAAGGGHLEVVKWLHANRVEGCSTVAMNSAAEGGHLDVVIWLHENRAEGCTRRALDRAAMNNHLETVRWLHMNRSEGCTHAAMNKAAMNGYLEMVMWLHEHRPECSIDQIPHSAAVSVLKWVLSMRPPTAMQFTMNRAAEKGGILTLQLLHHYHCEGASINEAAARAAKHGHLFVVQWLAETYPATINFATLYESTLRANQEHVLQWLRTR